MNDEKSKPRDICTRTFAYSLRAIKLYQFLEQGRNRAGRTIGKQFLRAATSVGANVEEAQSAESKADFIHKLAIAQKEARESLYWLRLLRASEIVSEKRIMAITTETEELVAIISKIIINAKKRREKNRTKI